MDASQIENFRCLGIGSISGFAALGEGSVQVVGIYHASETPDWKDSRFVTVEAGEPAEVGQAESAETGAPEDHVPAAGMQTTEPDGNLDAAPAGEIGASAVPRTMPLFPGFDCGREDGDSRTASGGSGGEGGEPVEVRGDRSGSRNALREVSTGGIRYHVQITQSEVRVRQFRGREWKSVSLEDVVDLVIGQMKLGTQ